MNNIKVYHHTSICGILIYTLMLFLLIYMNIIYLHNTTVRQTTTCARLSKSHMRDL